MKKVIFLLAILPSLIMPAHASGPIDSTGTITQPDNYGINQACPKANFSWNETYFACACVPYFEDTVISCGARPGTQIQRILFTCPSPLANHKKGEPFIAQNNCT